MRKSVVTDLTIGFFLLFFFISVISIYSYSLRTKLEPESYSDDMVTCSQIVYNYNPEKTKKV